MSWPRTPRGPGRLLFKQKVEERWRRVQVEIYPNASRSTSSDEMQALLTTGAAAPSLASSPYTRERGPTAPVEATRGVSAQKSPRAPRQRMAHKAHRLAYWHGMKQRRHPRRSSERARAEPAPALRVEASARRAPGVGTPRGNPKRARGTIQGTEHWRTPQPELVDSADDERPAELHAGDQRRPHPRDAHGAGKHIDEVTSR